MVEKHWTTKYWTSLVYRLKIQETNHVNKHWLGKSNTLIHTHNHTEFGESSQSRFSSQVCEEVWLCHCLISVGRTEPKTFGLSCWCKSVFVTLHSQMFSPRTHSAMVLHHFHQNWLLKSTFRYVVPVSRVLSPDNKPPPPLISHSQQLRDSCRCDATAWPSQSLCSD